MRTLVLRRLSPSLARLARALGTGMYLPFTVDEERAELWLDRAGPGDSEAAGVWFSSALGPLRLTDAAAVLGLLGRQAVLVDDSVQAGLYEWYWQFINEHLSPMIAYCLAPVLPLDNLPPDGELLQCRLAVKRGEQYLYAWLVAAPETFMRWLDVAPWRRHANGLEQTFTLPLPWVLAQLVLTVEQLRSLRPADVLLPPLCLFDIQGNGQVQLGDNTLPAHALYRDNRLFVELGPQENHLDD